MNTTVTLVISTIAVYFCVMQCEKPILQNNNDPASYG